MTDSVSLCNLALAALGAKSITALTEDSVAARECSRVYAHARDSETRAHSWGFARTQVQVAADSTNPIFGAARRYLKPSDCLRILPTEGQGASDTQDDFATYGRYIHTDHSSPINLIYLKRVTDENEFDQLFADLLVKRIAKDIAEKVTQSNTKKKKATEDYDAAKKEARRINSFEKPPEKPPDDKWITARL